MAQIKVLFLAANPLGSEQIRWDEEYRVIQQIARDSESRKLRIVVELRSAVQASHLKPAIKEVRPAIVHFSTHCESGTGMVLDDGRGQKYHLGFPALGEVFRQLLGEGIKIPCVVLNGCSTAEAAKEIVKHVDLVICTDREIADDATIAFSPGFYENLTEGKTIRGMMEGGKLGIMMIDQQAQSGAGIADLFQPESYLAYFRPGLNPEDFELTPRDPSVSTEDDEIRWKTHRSSIQKELEKRLEVLGKYKGRGSPVLTRVAEALAIESVPSHKIRIKIVTHLMEAEDPSAIPRIVGLHEELCRERLDRSVVESLAECIDQVLPLYFSREAANEAWRQLQVQQAVLIEGRVATPVGAAIVMAYVDGKSPRFLPPEEGIPRGMAQIRIELPADGDPSSDVKSIAILDDLLKASSARSIGRVRPRGVSQVPLELPAIDDLTFKEMVLEFLKGIGRDARLPQTDKARTESQHRDVAAWIDKFRQDLCSWLEPLKLMGQTPYCALAMPTTPADRVNLMNVLETVHRLVPHLVFIELDPDSQTRGQELFLIQCLNTRFNSELQRRPRSGFRK
jgi:hypothetical protein